MPASTGLLPPSFVRRFASVTLALLALVPLAPGREAAACSFNEQSWEPSPEEQAVDKTPPERVGGASVTVVRGKGPEEDGCSSSMATSCDDIGTIRLRVTPPKDDRTTAQRMGYKLRLVSGQAPFTLPQKPQLAPDGELVLRWADGASDEQDAFSFEVAITAVDLAGNEGPESAPIRVSDDGSSEGCNASRRRGRLPLEALLVGLAAWAASRRARGGRR